MFPKSTLKKGPTDYHEKANNNSKIKNTTKCNINEIFSYSFS